MTHSSGLQHTNLVVEPEGEPEWPAAIPPRPALIPAETPAGLSQAARQALPDTLSENTKRVYRSALQSLNERLAGRCACDEHLSEVLAEMSAERLSESTLRVAVAAVNKEAELAGFGEPLWQVHEDGAESARPQSAPTTAGDSRRLAGSGSGSGAGSQRTTAGSGRAPRRRVDRCDVGLRSAGL